MTLKTAIFVQAIAVTFVTLADAEFHTSFRKLSESRFPPGGEKDGPATTFRRMNHQDGSYQFGYDTGSNGPQSFREEHRASNGEVHGRYGFIDKQGLLRVTEYVAGRSGYRSEQSIRSPVSLAQTKLYAFSGSRRAMNRNRPPIGGTPVWAEGSVPRIGGLLSEVRDS